MTSNVETNNLTLNKRKRNMETAVPVAYKDDGNETDNSAENIHNIFGTKKASEIGFKDIP